MTVPAFLINVGEYVLAVLKDERATLVVMHQASVSLVTLIDYIEQTPKMRTLAPCP